MLVSAVLIHQRYFIRIFSQDYISYDMKSFCVSHKMTHTMMLVYPMYPFAVYSLRGTWSVGFAGWFSLWVMFYVFDEWFLGKLRGSLDFLHTIIKHKSWMKRTSTILVNGEKNLIKSIIQRCLLVSLNMIINDCSSFVFEVPITSRARSYDPSVEPAPKR